MPTASSLRLLVIEDDPRMLELLRKGLWEHGHLVLAASNGHEGLELGERHDFDAIILDIGLPELDGYQVAAHLRAAQKTAPIIMLTAMDMEDDIIRGLDLGADDYMTKPFSFRELLARLESLSRRVAKRSPTPEMGFADLRLDPVRQRVVHSGREISLTKSEFLLLQELMRHPGQPRSREALADKVWGSAPVKRGVLDTLINSLRLKLDELNCESLIRTVRGLGYCLQCGPAMMQKQDAP
jgi:DNA-binding response OmpR family regulator